MIMPGGSVAVAVVLPVLAASLLASGCHRGAVAVQDAAEQADAVVREAYALMERGDNGAAIRAFADALDAHPLLARPHLDLALLLHDQREDYIAAIYHYRRYLDLQPETEKRALIEGRIGHAARAYAVTAGTLESDELPSEALKRLERDNRRLQAQAVAFSNAVSEVRAELELALAERDAAAARAETAEQARAEAQDALRRARQAPAPTVAAVAPAPSGEGEAAAPATLAYTVQNGDNLSRIAARYYGDAALWPRILDANMDVLKGSVTVRPGQVLQIPGANSGEVRDEY